QVQILSPQPKNLTITNGWYQTKTLVYGPCKNESTPSQRFARPPETQGLLHSGAISGCGASVTIETIAPLLYDSVIP
ncbi:hypothetical protein, partial [Paracoccus sp. DMF]|uniref:hypothetical protein n=1 Tax=Paracoccus sp. DMF TaxID=400837 RepID=UPI0021E40CAB